MSDLHLNPNLLSAFIAHHFNGGTTLQDLTALDEMLQWAAYGKLSA